MNRRQVLGSIGAGLSGVLVTRVCPAGLTDRPPPPATSMGITVYCFNIRRRSLRAAGQPDLAEPATFLEHCHRLGAGGVQLPLRVREQAYARELRRQAESYGMYIEAIAGLPFKRAEVERFEAEVRTASAAGVGAIRVTMIPGRRYERFQSADEFRQYVQRGVKALELAEPVAARHRVPLAVENHKDQRVPERLAVLKRISSEYLGACVDTGNSFALLEDPLEVVEAYAPWAHAVHLKDQAVREYRDGFLLGDVPLGQGFLPLKQMVQTLRKAKPSLRFSLELITRDALKVPCLTDRYWSTLAEVSGRELARTLRLVRARSANRLQHVSGLAGPEQERLEAENVLQSLAYARQELGL